MSSPPAILFTAFEPSGDEHAAPVIARLRELNPGVTIYALGGPKMAAAGAQLVETTTEHPVMLLGAVAQAWAHRQRLGRLKQFLREHPIAALVPVDSPAANWSICALICKQQPAAKIVHLVAPQLWAWAPWRIGKLRRLTDRVLCILPFEPEWFESRGVPATFVGHPIYDLATGPLAHVAPLPEPPGGAPRVALLPGSRMGEINANWPMMLEIFKRLRTQHPQISGLVAAANEKVAQRIRELTARAGETPHPAAGAATLSHQGRGRFEGIEIRLGQTHSILAWADVVLATSGTATLHVAAHRKPMVVVFNVPRLNWELVGRWVVHTRTFSLPNLLDPGDETGRLVPEFVPHFGHVDPVYDAVAKLIDDPAARVRQVAGLERIASRFAGHVFSDGAARAILAMLDPEN